MIAWPVRGAVARLVCLLLLPFFAVYFGAIISNYLLHPRYVDFFNFWSAARFVAVHPAVDIYDQTLFEDFQHQLDPGSTDSYRFLYPPSLLLLAAPLGALPYPVACAGWTLLGLAAYLAAVCGPAWRRPVVAALLVAPSTTVAIFYGQTGLLAAALLLGGLRLLRSRPLLAGVLLGLLTLKPQFGVLVPVALLAGGYWRGILAAGVTFLALFAASGLAFGWTIWPTWVASLGVNAPPVEADRLRLDVLMPTVAANLDMLGASLAVVKAAQIGSALLCLALTWLAWRHGARRLGIAAVAAAAMLVTPYAYVYDMPILAAAVVLTFEDAEATGWPLGLIETLVLAAGMLLPAEMFTPFGPPLPIAVLVVAAVLAVILRRIWLPPRRKAKS